MVEKTLQRFLPFTPVKLLLARLLSCLIAALWATTHYTLAKLSTGENSFCTSKLEENLN
jgi:hypothetical protein